MAFLNNNRRFGSPAELEAHLRTIAPPSWVKGSTYHNTYIPNESQWRGHASMVSMQGSYQKKTPPWDRGPHLYLAVGTAFDGIYNMTPLTVPGIHAGDCNDERFGLEVVGDFQARPMSPAQLELLLQVLVILHKWARLGADVNDHRTCMPGRTCPGDEAHEQLPKIRTELARRLSAPAEPDWNALWGPIATPDNTSWNWDLPRTWKANAQRLGRCIYPAVYPRKGIVTQWFDKGSITCNGSECKVEEYP